MAQKSTQPVNKGGRPAKYQPFRQKILDGYLETCTDQTDKKGRLTSTKLPSAEGFALYLGIHKDTLYTWAKSDSGYQHALNEIHLRQREKLIYNALAGYYNSAIAKLILQTNHGMTERSQTNHREVLGYVQRIYQEADQIEAEMKNKQENTTGA
jgi:hypothetical protein